MANIDCVRCDEGGAPLPFQPFNNDLGKRIHAEICQTCWQQWLQYQTALINHYGLNVQDKEARGFLLENTEKYLFGTGDTEDIDTSKEGTISW